MGYTAGMKLSVVLPSEVAHPLEKAAQILGCSVSQIVRKALELHLQSYRSDPAFQTARAAYLRTDDGLGPSPGDPGETPLDDRQAEVDAFIASQRAAVARMEKQV